jgi:surface antigen
MAIHKNSQKSRKHKTVGLRKVIAIAAVVSAILISESFIFETSEEVQAYPAGCVTQACREASDRATASANRARELAASAQTLENEVNRLNAEIAMLEDEIAMNQAIANDLQAQIILNEAKLNLQQSALAKLLVDMHFDEEPDAILVLASSNSLGDLAERQTRQTNAKTQVTTSAEAIKTLKEELEGQKSSVDALIASAEATRTEISNRRNEQQALIARYENDSAAYERDAAAARETMQKEIAAEIAKYNNGGVVGEGYNSYPWAHRCPQDNVGYIVVGGYVCQCTSYAGWKAQEYFGIYISSWGDAKSWGYSAQRAGYVVNDTPAPHTIAYSTSGIYGHVMWVESINANGTINLTEYNNSASSKSHLPGDFGARYNVNPALYRYIHLDQRLW